MRSPTGFTDTAEMVDCHAVDIQVTGTDGTGGLAGAARQGWYEGCSASGVVIDQTPTGSAPAGATITLTTEPYQQETPGGGGGTPETGDGTQTTPSTGGDA